MMKGNTSKIRLKDFNAPEAEAFYGEMKRIENKVRSAYIKANPGHVAEAEAEFASAINLRDIIKRLPKSQRQHILSEYSKLLNFQSLVKDDRHIFTTEVKSTGKLVGRFDIHMGEPGKALNPMSIFLNRMTLNKNYITDKWQFGGNILKSDHLRTLTTPLHERVRGLGGKGAKGSVLVFDTETAGLGNGSVREIAAHRMRTGVVEDGTSVILDFERGPAAGFQQTLDTALMKLGSARNATLGRTQTLDQVALLKHGIGYTAGGGPGSGEDFALVVYKFLDEVSSADAVAGHNLSFDLGQIFQGVAKTSRYKTDGKFRAKVLQAQKEINNKVIDTLEYARQIVPDIGIAPEVAFSGKVTSHSMENLMLKTNLIDEMAEDMGGAAKVALTDAESHGLSDVAQKALLAKKQREVGYGKVLELYQARGGGGGVHNGLVDARVEGYLLKLLAEDATGGERRLKALGEGEVFGVVNTTGKGARETSSVILKMQSLIRTTMAKSYAITPTTQIGDAGDISDKVLKILYDKDKIQVLPDGATEGASARVHYGSLKKAKEELRGNNAPYADFQETPIEHSILASRKLGMEVNSDAKNVRRGGEYVAEFACSDVE